MAHRSDGRNLPAGKVPRKRDGVAGTNSVPILESRFLTPFLPKAPNLITTDDRT